MLLNLDYQVIDVIEDVTIEAKSLEVKDFQSLARFTSSVMATNSNDKTPEHSGLEKLSDEKLVEIAKEIIPKYCRNIKGISLVQEGTERPATIEDIVTFGAFTPIIVNILTKLLIISTINKKQELKKQ